MFGHPSSERPQEIGLNFGWGEGWGGGIPHLVKKTANFLLYFFKASLSLRFVFRRSSFESHEHHSSKLLDLFYK